MRHGKKIQRKIDEIIRLENTIEQNTKIILNLTQKIHELEDDKVQQHDIIKLLRQRLARLDKRK